MSRAFVSEVDGDAVDGDLPERPVSAHPNYVTPAGAAAMRARAEALRAELQGLAGVGEEGVAARATRRRLERDLRWVAARVASAIVVDPDGQPRDEVRFGARVTAADEDGVVVNVRIVGEDEVEAGEGRVSWVSPLARALAGASVGDEVTWKRPSGEGVLTVLGIEYSES